MIKRIASFILGFFLVAIVVILGIKSTIETSFVLWFGIASAIVAPLGLTAIGYSFRGKNQEIIERFSKVSAIKNLIQQAETQEERIRLLEQERERIIEVVRTETLKRAILERKEMLEKEAAKVLKDLDSIDQELKILDSTYEASIVKTEVKELYERLQARKKGDLVISIGSNYYRIDQQYILKIMPIGLGDIVILCLKLIEEVSRNRKLKFKKGY